MDLAEGFRFHEDGIVRQWVDYTMSTYGAKGFFLKETDRFANPVGVNIKDGLSRLYKLLTTGADTGKLAEPLEQILAIRSVQEFSPSQALAPINAVKHITRDAFAKDKERKHLLAELYDFEFAVDLTMLAAFDIYMKYRERLYQVRIDEIKSGRNMATDSVCPSKLLAKDSLQVLKKG